MISSGPDDPGPVGPRPSSSCPAELVRNGTVGEPLAAFLAALVRARKNLLISGGTAVEKTAMLRALASAIPEDERLITIEDSLELCLDWDTAATPMWWRCSPGSPDPP